MLGLLNSSIRRGTILGMRPWFSPEDLPAEQIRVCSWIKYVLCASEGRVSRRKTVLLPGKLEAITSQMADRGASLAYRS